MPKKYPISLKTQNAVTPRRILIVDDSRAQRKILTISLLRWGFEVTEAENAEDALALCTNYQFDIIISDWVMPGMSGLEFCKKFRSLQNDSYSYFILLTSKSEKGEMINGFECGADDFLTKPVSAEELHARLRAGERIITMQSELLEKNRWISKTFDELQKLYDSLDRDLVEARKLQETLMREKYRDFTKGSVSTFLRPSGHVGGDLAGFFDINPECIALYSVDVAGHGVASAMMTARLAGLLSGSAPDQNIALAGGINGTISAWPPEMVATKLNRMMLNDLQVDQYFTMAYAEINLKTGLASLVQAGHPHPLILRQNGQIEQLGNGGMPIGLLPNARYERLDAQLFAGDRLFLLSDGITECSNPENMEFGMNGLVHFLTQHTHLTNEALLEALIWTLQEYAHSDDFSDDVSGAIFHYTG